MRTLEKLTIQNFKSIRHQELNLGRLNVFIGGNGAGKSNLIQAFRFLRRIADGKLHEYSLATGSERLLYFGRKTSKFIEFSVEFADLGTSNGYSIELLPSDDGSLIPGSEAIWFHDRSKVPQPQRPTILVGGGREAAIRSSSEKVAHYVRQDLDSYRVYHLHDTSDSARVKMPGPIDDNRFLREDAANLAAFLYLLQQRHPQCFRNIEDVIRQIAPFFDRFNLEPRRLNPAEIRLEWREKGSDDYFDATALSDGTLRFMCLATLLLQPELPAVVLLDEPELGLHPAAIALLADLLTAASRRTQVVVATQSVTLVNQFGPEDIWTVDREDRQSVFRHLGGEDLRVWLEKFGDYEGFSLGELWEKNLIGAQP